MGQGRVYIFKPTLMWRWKEKEIRVNLDTRPMKDAVKTFHFPIPTPQELRHNFAGSDRYSVIDLNHAFHQFKMDEESQDLFVFYTPWGLYKYIILVMGVSRASSKCHERIRLVVEGLEGVQQNIVVHGDGKEHDIRLEALLERLAEIECPALGLVLCHPGWQGLGLEWDLYMGTSGKWSITTVNLVPYKYILLLSTLVSTRLSPSVSILSKPQPQLNST